MNRYVAIEKLVCIHAKAVFYKAQKQKSKVRVNSGVDYLVLNI
jgi:hypothetical protein